MKNILLKSLHVKNFKGFKNKSFSFKDQVLIFGANGTGKTSIYDAILWLLFGKDHTGRADFSIKPQDEDGNPIPKLEIEVEAELNIDGQTTTLKRVFKEKWQKRRGELKATFTGNETQYFWNSVPKKQSEYQKNINDLLSEDIFKLITNPLAFSELHWESARAILTEIVGDVKDEDVAKSSKEFQDLLDKLQNKSLAEYKSQIKAEIKGYKDRIKQIPARIDEVYYNKPEPVNEEELNSQLNSVNKEIESLETKIQDQNKAQEEELQKLSELNAKKFELQNKANSVKNRLRNEITSQHHDFRSEIVRLETRSDSFKSDLKSIEYNADKLSREFKANSDEIQDIDKEISEARKAWEEENKSELKFDEDSFKCPTCGNPLSAKDVESEKQKMVQDFNKDKREGLDKLEKRAEGLNKTKTSLLERNKIIEESKASLLKNAGEIKTKVNKDIDLIKELNAKLENQPDTEKLVSEAFENSEDLKSIETEIKSIDKALEDRPGFDVSELRSEVQSKRNELEQIKDQLKVSDQIEKADKRIEELQKEEEDLAQQIADREKEEFLAENFETAKIKTLEAKINKLFSKVKFKMFNQLVNGSTEKTCVPLINGVPFKDANTAGQINAGIDIISTLSKHYGVTAPVVVDNRESVTNLIDTPSQVISLIVSPADKTLRIE